MNAQTLHAVAASARHMVHGRRLALSLLGAAVLVTLLTLGLYRFTAVPAAPGVRSQPTAPLVTADQPIHAAARSAYTGQTAPAARPAPAAPLGIDIPSGMDVHTMDPGLTDYLRSNSTFPAAQASAPPPGINCSASELETMPPGLTDYCRR